MSIEFASCIHCEICGEKLGITEKELREKYWIPEKRIFCERCKDTPEAKELQNKLDKIK